MKRRLFLGMSVWLATTAVASAQSSNASSDSFVALAGAGARGFVLPDGFRLERTGRLARYGLRWERYQQYQDGLPVLGAELTLHKDVRGQIVLVVGDAYPRIALTNRARLTRFVAKRVAEREVGRGGEWLDRLVIDPATGRLVYRIESRRFLSQWQLWVDAESGRVLRRFNALPTSEGLGVKGDLKDLAGLTTTRWGRYLLRSPGRRQTVRDARSRPFGQFLGTILPPFLLGSVAADDDDEWVEPGRSSPGQAALVDAAYYLSVADAYFQTVHGRDSFDDAGHDITAVAHFGTDFSNAFWNSRFLVFGDGDGHSFREFSGALDVVAHEFTHAVTQYTSTLLYIGESGALNESFSDIMGSSAEFFADAHGLDPAASADWLISEDIDLRADTEPGFRNMADPAEDGDPDHYSERQIGGGDNGGVHTNSSIPNHAYYLLVNGGSNAGEARGHAHTGPVVDGIGLATAEQIFYVGFTSLSLLSNMCRARLATEAAAAALAPAAAASVSDAWEAVGVPDDCGRRAAQ